MRPTLQDDDDVAGLPARDGDSESEGVPLDGLEPEDTTEEDEQVGLDAEAGIDEPLDADLALSPGDEHQSFLEGSETPADTSPEPDDEDLESGGAEYGWVLESEPLEDQSLSDEDSGLIEGESGLLDDQGEEGFGDDALAASLDLGALPPLDAEPESESEAEQAPPRASRPSPPIVTRPSVAPSVRGELRLHARQVHIEVLQRSGRPLRALCTAGATGLAWDGSLLIAEPGGSKPERRFAGSDALGALAAIAREEREEREQRVQVVLVTPEALLSSNDGGRVFSVRSDWPHAMPASSVALVRRPEGGVRLLAAAPLGGLLASDDGRPFFALGPERGIVRLASDGGSSALALMRGEDNEPLIALTRDAGDSFELLDAPVDVLERAQDLQVAHGAILCCRRAPEPRVLWGRSDAFHPLLDGAAAPMRILNEHRAAVAYACITRREQVLLVRRALPDREHAGVESLGPVEIVTELPKELGAPLQLAGAHDGGITTLHVGTERAWLRLTILPGGDDA
jgi:hypothetical protein